MPDLFNGDSSPTTAAIEEEDTGSFLDQFKMRAVETAKSFMIDMWMARHTEEKILPILHRVIDGCKEKFADAVKHGDGIYAVGYCIGGRYVLLLGSETPAPAGQPADEEEGAVRKGPLIKVGALAHAASVMPDDFKALKVPVSLVCVENDPLFPDEVRTVGEDAMASANLEHEVRVYPGVPHGECPSLLHLKLLTETNRVQDSRWLGSTRTGASRRRRRRRMTRCLSGFRIIESVLVAWIGMFGRSWWLHVYLRRRTRYCLLVLSVVRPRDGCDIGGASGAVGPS